MISLGIPNHAIRIRQHLHDEKAHYSNDCWDIEIYTNYGWTEVVGIADRSCFDLQQHNHHSDKGDFYATRILQEPYTKDYLKLHI